MPALRRTPRQLDTPDEVRRLDRWYIVGLCCMAALVIAFPLYNRGEPARRAAAQAEMANTNVALGGDMFAQHCAACHGDGARGGRTAPTLAAREFLGSVSDKQLHWLIRGGVPGSAMTAYDIDIGGPFTAQEITRLTAYLRSLEPGAPSVQGWFKGAAAPPPAAQPRRDATRDEKRDDRRDHAGAGLRRGDDEHGPGQPDSAEADAVAQVKVVEVYAARCAACHGARGEGTAIAPSVRPMRAPLAQQAEQAFVIISRGVPGTAMAPFAKTHNGPLDETSIRALVKWMREGTPGAR